MNVGIPERSASKTGMNVGIPERSASKIRDERRNYSVTEKQLILECCPDYVNQNGKCQACPAGKYGRDCSLPCMPNYHGVQCKKLCNCADYKKCDPVYGCVCDTGYTGSECSNECPSGRYGVNCSEECFCEHEAKCNTVTGDCLCSAGWLGDHCTSDKNFDLRMVHQSMTDGTIESWATEAEITAVCEMYNYTIFVKTKIDEIVAWIRYSPINSTNNNKRWIAIEHLQNHFNLLRFKQKKNVYVSRFILQRATFKNKSSKGRRREWSQTAQVINLRKKEEENALNDILKDDNIVIRPADKGPGIVVIDKEDYFEKLEEEIKNNDTYSETEGARHMKLQKKVKLYPSIPREEVLKASCDTRKNIEMPTKYILGMIKIVLNGNNFRLMDRYILQNESVAIGSKLGKTVTCTYMRQWDKAGEVQGETITLQAVH
ncbi:MEGF10_11 [Mytilus coruscus]|uniref:MEGF10_11 n=1 Tax=Mytilus coruscus TaxID=42192 RepID=A0A6J8CLQ4_MYTCO|nr:MEGF10_11 [Mytilus coruscus]